MNFEAVNLYAKLGIPFLFISNFKADDIIVIPLDELHKHDVEFSIKVPSLDMKKKSLLKKYPSSYQNYKKKFDKVIEKIKSGDTYLLNLTQESKIETKLDLKEMFKLSNAHYKLRYKNDFLCFSPETFIQISDNTIDTFPMKGTIDANIKDAQAKILKNEKEMAEHTMVVDLLRNDLSMVSKNVQVKRFRYITEIEAGDKNLLQVSSHISGSLSQEWPQHLGNILKALLPAGSISGTPKLSSLNIIDNLEEYERGFYTGVFGVFDGKSFDSGVMIRFIENTDDGYIYKSGGGITLDSSSKDEYKELLDKIYLA